MADICPTTGAGASAPGKSEKISSLSRRAVFGAVAAATLVAAVPALAVPDAAGWRAEKWICNWLSIGNRVHAAAGGKVVLWYDMRGERTLWAESLQTRLAAQLDDAALKREVWIYLSRKEGLAAWA